MDQETKPSMKQQIKERIQTIYLQDGVDFYRTEEFIRHLHNNDRKAIHECFRELVQEGILSVRFEEKGHPPPNEVLENMGIRLTRKGKAALMTPAESAQPAS